MKALVDRMKRTRSVRVAWSTAVVSALLIVGAGCARPTTVQTRADPPKTATGPIAAVVGTASLSFGREPGQSATTLTVRSGTKARSIDLPGSEPLIRPTVLPGSDDRHALIVGVPCSATSPDDDSCDLAEPKVRTLDLDTLRFTPDHSPLDLRRDEGPMLSGTFADAATAFALVRFAKPISGASFTIAERTPRGWVDRGAPSVPASLGERPSPQPCSVGSAGLVALVTGYGPDTPQLHADGKPVSSFPAASAVLFGQSTATGPWIAIEMPDGVAELDANHLRLACSTGMMAIVETDGDRERPRRIYLAPTDAAPAEGAAPPWAVIEAGPASVHLDVSSDGAVVAVTAPMGDDAPVLARARKGVLESAPVDSTGGAPTGAAGSQPANGSLALAPRYFPPPGQAPNPVLIDGSTIDAGTVAWRVIR